MGCQRDPQVLRSDLPLLRKAATALHISLDEAQYTAFGAYFELLTARASVMNLTRVRDLEGVQRRHFIESLALGSLLSGSKLLDGEKRLIDVGSGAGFPGIPLRIAWPELRLTLLESTRKKAAFLGEVVDRLQLGRVQVITDRAEDAAHRPGLRESFDVVTARAVAPLATLVELTLPFLARGGLLAAVKGSRLEQEIDAAAEAIRRCGGGSPRVLVLPESEGVFPPRLVLIQKLRATPRTLPRRAGLPYSQPLRPVQRFV